MNYHSYSSSENNNNLNMSSVHDPNSVNWPQHPFISNQAPPPPLYHSVNYSRNYIVPGSDDDHLRLIYFYVIFPIFMFFYLLYSYLSFTTPFPTNKNANEFAFEAVGTICSLSMHAINNVRARFNGKKQKWHFKFVVVAICSVLIFILFFSLKFLYLYTELVHSALVHLYRFPLWFTYIPSSYIFYHLIHSCISGCIRFLFVCCLLVSVPSLKSLLESKACKTSVH